MLYYSVDWNTYRSSLDYFNPCTNSLEANMPNKFAGFQYSSIGNTYAGFGTSYFEDYREIIGGALSDSLMPGIIPIANI